MRDDCLEQLLTRADAALPPRAAEGLLIDRMHARRSRQARSQVGLGILAAVLIVGILAHSLHSKRALVRETAPSRVTPDADHWRTEWLALEATATQQHKLAEELAQVEQQSRSRQRIEAQLIATADPLSYVQEARDRAARILLIDGDRLATHERSRSQAEANYRRAVQLFPETAAAHEAATRLKMNGA